MTQRERVQRLIRLVETRAWDRDLKLVLAAECHHLGIDTGRFDSPGDLVEALEALELTAPLTSTQRMAEPRRQINLTDQAIHLIRIALETAHKTCEEYPGGPSPRSRTEQYELLVERFGELDSKEDWE